MRKTFLNAFVIALLSTFQLYAQTDQPEVKFWGISFGSSRQVVAQEMRKKGGQSAGSSSGMDYWTVQSPFAGRKVEVVAVSFTPDGRFSAGAIVLESWNDKGIFDSYEQFKEMLISKYGQPYEDVDQYEDPDRSSYLEKFTALKLDKYRLESLWLVGEKDQEVRIKIMLDSKCQIYVYYAKASLIAEKAQKDLDDL